MSSGPERRRRSVALRLLGAVVLGAVVLGAAIFGDASAPAPTPTTAPSALEVDWAGCVDVLGPPEAPTCLLDPTRPTLRLWARSSSGAGDPPRRIHGARAARPPEPIQGGWLWHLTVEPRAAEIVLHADDERDTGGFALPLAWDEPLPDGDRAGVRAALRRATSDAERGRLAFLGATRDQRPAHAAALFRQAAWHFERAGRVRGRIHALTRLHHVLYSALDDRKAAQRALDALPEPPAGDATSALVVALFEAPWNARLGRLRTALRSLEDAERRAERLDDPFLLYTRQPQTFLAGRLGLFERALELVEWLRPRAEQLENPCRRSDLFTDLAWSQILILESMTTEVPASRPPAERRPDPDPDLREAARLAAGCSPFQRANTALNLALGHLHADRPEAARRALVSAGSSLPDSSFLDAWRLEVDARIALAEGRVEDALEVFRAAEIRAGRRHEAGEPWRGDHWRATIGRAQALRRLGRVEDALRAFAEAEDLLDAHTFGIPWLEPRGPESAFVFFERGSRLHLDLLAETGRWTRALEVSRRSRRRALDRLERSARAGEVDTATRRRRQEAQRALRAEREALLDAASEAPRGALEGLAARRRQLTIAQEDVLGDALGDLQAGSPEPRTLAPPRSGEMLLVVHPLPDGWLGLAALDGETTGHRLSARDLPAGLLAPFADRLRRAVSLRVLTYGPLEAIDVHGLPFGSEGGILLDARPVVYGLDLPPRREPWTARPGTPSHALVVADPSRSLRHAASEARSVRRRLEQAAWSTVGLGDGLGDDDVTPTTVRAAFDERPVDLFHWAGHIDPRGDALRDAGLLFDRGRRMGLADLLTLERAPRRVVLSSCSAVGPGHAERAGGARAVGLGLGQSFVLAGSEWVVGPTGPVDDADAARLAERFYRAWLEGPGPLAETPEVSGAAHALRTAQLALREERPDGDWCRFRLLAR